MARSDYKRNVFINCPFDEQYKPLFEALVFAVFDCGFRARCALELDDAGEVRIDIIARIIEDCKYGVHDVSRTAPDPGSGLPRFNMPFELGLFLGARRFGRGRQQKKVCLVLDAAQYRYQQFISDIAGQDVKAHGDDPARLIAAVRKWLRTSSGAPMPGGAEIGRRYDLFRQGLPLLCEELRLRPEEMTFNDYADQISKWIVTE